MQRQHFGIIGVLATAAGIAGCVPATLVQVPAIRGRVVGSGGTPASNATVHIVRDSDRSEVAAVPTKPDGTFSRAEDGHFFFQVAGADAAGIAETYTISATANGHRSPTTQVDVSGGGEVRRLYDPSTDRDLGTLVVP